MKQKTCRMSRVTGEDLLRTDPPTNRLFGKEQFGGARMGRRAPDTLASWLDRVAIMVRAAKLHPWRKSMGEDAIEPTPCFRGGLLSRFPSRAQLEAHE
jgi:hypothetical protein